MHPNLVRHIGMGSIIFLFWYGRISPQDLVSSCPSEHLFFKNILAAFKNFLKFHYTIKFSNVMSTFGPFTHIYHPWRYGHFSSWNTAQQTKCMFALVYIAWLCSFSYTFTRRMDKSKMNENTARHTYAHICTFADCYVIRILIILWARQSQLGNSAGSLGDKFSKSVFVRNLVFWVFLVVKL